MIASEASDGHRIARLFRQYRDVGNDERRCDLDRILVEDAITVRESRISDPGYTACLLPPKPERPAGILLAPGQERGRRRFSIAHELGHFHIPSHSGLAIGGCREDDMAAFSDTVDTIEREANEFATELLMPRRHFRRDATEREPSFESIIELAGPAMYDVSVTAAALRFVNVTEHRCALVSAVEGTINWVFKSIDFPYRIPWIGDRLPVDSLAAYAANGQGGVGGAEELDPYVWLEIEQRRPIEVFESCLPIPSQQQVLSLLWIVPEGSWV